MLRSSTAHLLQRPRVVTSVASRAFTVAAPTVWNSLSVNTRCADSFAASFKRRLKSELSCIYLRHLGRFSAITALRFVFYMRSISRLVVVKAAAADNLKAFKMTCYRRMLRSSWRDHSTNESVMNEIGADRELVATIRKQIYSRLLRSAWLVVNTSKDVFQRNPQP